MNLLIVGSDNQMQEARAKFGGAHEYMRAESSAAVGEFLKKSDVVFDFTIEEDISRVNRYNQPVFLDTSFVSLSQIAQGTSPKSLFGFCGMSTFLNREVLEVSLAQEDHLQNLKEACASLKTEYRIVADRVGLVTPRVICMIINEAYYTLQEGTATREDIDLAMKLGTNYPFGPFEWGGQIGIKNVCRLLEVVYRDTNDNRYKVCPLLDEESKKSPR